MCFNTVLSELASNYPDVRDIIISAQIEVFTVTSDIIVDICDQVQPQFQTKCMYLFSLQLIELRLISVSEYENLILG